VCMYTYKFFLLGMYQIRTQKRSKPLSGSRRTFSKSLLLRDFA
jgi:hypothetical protein